MLYRERIQAKQKRRRKLLVMLVICMILLLGAVGGGVTYMMRRSVSGEQPQASTPTVKASSPVQEKPKPKLIDVQPVVDRWTAKQSGDYGIVVFDPDNQQIVGAHQADKQFFTASIYKLFAVYLSLQDVDAGKHALAEDFKFGKTRQTCLFDAIHSSDSPCAEAFMAELGVSNVNQRLAAFGLVNTQFPGYVTTAADVARVLERLQARKDLSQASTDLLLNAMSTQIYRAGLPTGVAPATIADKVGFSETPHYHDVGVVTLPGGRQYIVVYLSQSAGSRQAADFGKTLYQSLTE